MQQWRWTLTSYSEVEIPLQESGGQPDLRKAMDDIANTVEYIINQ